MWLVVFVSFFGVLQAAPSGPRAQVSPYVEYLPSTGLNIILSSPHGGSDQPSYIPDRDYGCWDGSVCIWSHDCGTKDTSRCKTTTSKDLHTQELTRELRSELCNKFGACPAAIINLLHRRKFDANRDKDEASFNVPEVMLAWDNYHMYIDQEKADMGGRGLFLDMHGHSHSQQWAELGYLVSASKLNSGTIDPDTTSIRSLNDNKPLVPFETLLRGLNSFGDLLEKESFPSVPSPAIHSPGSNSYYSGGYNTRRHGSRDGGLVDAIQIESARSHRDLPMRVSYVAALRETVFNYMMTHYP